MSFLQLSVVALFLGISALLPLHTFAYIHLLLKASRYKLPSAKKDKDWERAPFVSVHLPIYNEKYVIERLLRSACSFDYPKDRYEVIVVDDSTDETPQICKAVIEQIKKEGFSNIKYIRRKERKDFKAGALQEALLNSRGEFIAIFDADFIPPKDFLKQTLRFFTSDDVGLVQARWGHLNRDYSTLTAAQALSLDLHFKVEQAGRYSGGFFLNFNGTAGVWRRRCIEDAGGWRPSLAEDLDLSYRAQLKGWRIVYVDSLEAPAELPIQANAARRQQYRWAYGSIQTAMNYLPAVLSSKISLVRKIHAVIHLTRHLPQLLLLAQVMLIPLVIRIGVPTRLETMVWWILLYPISITVFMLLSSYKFLKKAYSSLSRFLKDTAALLIFGTGVSVNNAIALIHAMFSRHLSFQRTPKFGIIGRGGDWKGKDYALPLDYYSIFDIGIGIYALYATLVAFYQRAYSFIPVTSLVAVSLIFMGLLTIYHSKPRNKKINNTFYTTLIYTTPLIIAALFFSAYTFNAYAISKAMGEIERALVAVNPEEVITRIKNAADLIPSGGNPVWLFPTPASDLGLIKKDLLTLHSRLTTAVAEGDYYTIHAVLEDTNYALSSIQIQLNNLQPFTLITLAGLAAATAVTALIIINIIRG